MLCTSYKIKKYVKHHINTALRLSDKLAKKEVSDKERLNMEHLIFVHLNAARRAKKLI